MKVFIDIQAPCDVQLFKPVINALLSKSSLYVSARDYAETCGLLDLFNIKYDKIGSLSSGNNFVKTYETIKRTIKLYNKIKDLNIDVTISFGNLHSIYASKLDKTPCITIMDNELGLKKITPERSIFEWGVIKSQVKFSKFILVPEFFPKDALISEGISPDNVFSFEGYKENIYLSEYSPDPNFLDKLPFEEFLVVRPEATAIYKSSNNSVVPQLITKLLSSGYNIVYLPRLSEDTFLIKSFLASKQFFIPEFPLNGLDLCYYSRGVLSGSGTLTREAACLGKTAVSFLPSETLLAVDQSLINHNKLYHSRDIQDITNYILKSNSSFIDVNQEIEKSKILRDKFLSTLFQLFGKLNDG